MKLANVYRYLPCTGSPGIVGVVRSVPSVKRPPNGIDGAALQGSLTHKTNHSVQRHSLKHILKVSPIRKVIIY